MSEHEHMSCSTYNESDIHAILVDTNTFYNVVKLTYAFLFFFLLLLCFLLLFSVHRFSILQFGLVIVVAGAVVVASFFGFFSAWLLSSIFDADVNIEILPFSENVSDDRKEEEEATRKKPKIKYGSSGNGGGSGYGVEGKMSI